MKRFKSIYIEITNKCNLNCSFCSPSKREKKEISSLEFESILKKIDKYTDYINLHVKGEPLIHPELREILDLCDKYKKKVNLTTNGYLINKNINMLCNSKSLRQVNFSLHSYTGPSLIDYIKPILEATDKLVENNIYVSYRFWAIKNNSLDELALSLLEEIKKHFSIDGVLYNEIINKKSIKIRDNIYINKDIVFIWPSLDNSFEINTGMCYGLSTHFGILSDGTIIPCCLDSEGILNLGNIYEDDLNKVLSTEKVTKIVKGFKDNKRIEELCKKCNFLKRM